MSYESSGLHDRPNGAIGEVVDGRAALVFDVLSNERRRLALGYLLERDGPVDVGTLLDHVAAEVAVDGESGDALRPRLASMFHHAHLPKMEDAGLVEYDRGADEVARTETAAEIARQCDPALEPPGS